MKTLTKKQAILQSLEAMNASEMEKVLDYIKDMLYDHANDRNYQEFRKKAMQEIRVALDKDNERSMAV